MIFLAAAVLPVDNKFGSVDTGHTLQKGLPRSFHVPRHLPAGSLCVPDTKCAVYVPMALGVKLHLRVALGQTPTVFVRDIGQTLQHIDQKPVEIGRASCRERVWSRV